MDVKDLIADVAYMLNQIRYKDDWDKLHRILDYLLDKRDEEKKEETTETNLP